MSNINEDIVIEVFEREIESSGLVRFTIFLRNNEKFYCKVLSLAVYDNLTEHEKEIATGSKVSQEDNTDTYFAHSLKEMKEYLIKRHP